MAEITLNILKPSVNNLTVRIFMRAANLPCDEIDVWGRKDEPEFEAAELLYIHPDECIDCGACEPACPVQAIFTEDDLPEQWRHFTKINADWYNK